MAVHAQCSSNILLLNRTIQDGKTQIGHHYSLPPQPGGADIVLGHQLINHTFTNHYPVGNCGANHGKRRREDDNMNHMNQFTPNVHQQSHIQSRTVDVSTGLRLAFNDHQQQHLLDPQASGYTSVSSDDLANLINQHGDEIERYLQAQGDELRRKLAEKRQRHYHALIGAAKESAWRMIREKEAVAEKAVRRNVELEARAAQLSAEAQVWQAKARAQEAVAAALQVELQQAMVAGGVCVSEVAAGDAEDAESSYIDPERVVVVSGASGVSGPGCKACGKRVASVVLLPCRHLCVCSECDEVVQACPLCLSFRSSSIEVYLS